MGHPCSRSTSLVAAQLILEPSSTWKVRGTKLDPKLATAALARLQASPTAQFLVMRGQHDDRSISSIALLCESRSPLKLQQLYR